MDTNTQFAGGSVALIGLTSRDCERARDAVTLAGARVCSEPSSAILVLAAPGAPVPALVPCVRVGAGGQVVLPGDTALLVSLIAEASWRCVRTGPVWMVAGIAGGLGVTSLVRMLVRSTARPPWWRRWGSGVSCSVSSSMWNLRCGSYGAVATVRRLRCEGVLMSVGLREDYGGC